MLFVHKDGTLRIRNCKQSNRRAIIYTHTPPKSYRFSHREEENTILYFSYFYRAQERSAWRQARMKSLEQDALQAQKMIQSMNELADDILESKNEVILLNI